MIQFEKTQTIKKDGKKITNNIEQALITVNDEIYKPYCILATQLDEGQEKIIIKQANHVKPVYEFPENIRCIVCELIQQINKPKTNKKTNTKKEEETKGGQKQ